MHEDNDKTIAAEPSKTENEKVRSIDEYTAIRAKLHQAKFDRQSSIVSEVVSSFLQRSDGAPPFYRLPNGPETSGYLTTSAVTDPALSDQQAKELSEPLLSDEFKACLDALNEDSSLKEIHACEQNVAILAQHCKNLSTWLATLQYLASQRTVSMRQIAHSVEKSQTPEHVMLSILKQAGYSAADLQYLAEKLGEEGEAQ